MDTQGGGRLTLAQGAAVSIGAVLGTGVIGLPALAAQVAGPASLVAWLALVVLSVPLATTFGALGARYPDAGGVSTYVRTAFGPRAAALVGWCFYLAVPVGAPAAAMFAGAYVAAAVGGGTTTTMITSAVLIVVVAAVNAGGLRISGRVQLALVALLVVMLVTATVTALPHARWENLQPFAPNGWAAIAPAAAVLVWGFAGWEAVTSLAADFRNPRRDVPWATTIGVIVVAILYCGVAAASVLVLGPATGSSPAPLAELLAIGVGGQVRVITAAAAVLLTFGAMNAYFAGAAKLGAALGRDGALPAWLARGSSAGQVPRRSLSVVTVLAAVAMLVVVVAHLGPRSLVLLTTGVFVVVYLLGTAAAVKLLPARTWSRRAAVIACLSSLGLLVVTGVYMVWAGALLVLGLLYQLATRRRPVVAVAESTDYSSEVSVR